MFRNRTVAGMLMLIIFCGACPALAQSDAKTLFTQGKTLYAKGEFTQARALFLKASYTDDKNPEVFLALGKACYQLGHLDQAMAAWTRVLKLAPNEPYAKKMLIVLRGQLTAPADRIAVIRRLLDEQLHKTALQQCRELVNDKALTNAQRAEALTLQAEALLETCDIAGAMASLQEIAVRYPKLHNQPQCALLLGRAKLTLGGQSAKGGLAILKSIAAAKIASPQSIRAKYELILHAMNQKATAATTQALKTWIAKHPNHRMAQPARKRLQSVYLSLASESALPNDSTITSSLPAPLAKLSSYDLAAIAVTNDYVKHSTFASHAVAMVKTMADHIVARYNRAKRYALCTEGLAMLQQPTLHKAGHILILRHIAKCRSMEVIKELSKLDATGRWPAAMPQSVTLAIKAYDDLHKIQPNGKAMKEFAELGYVLEQRGRSIPWPTKPTTLKPIYQWAKTIALHVLKTTNDSSAVSIAIRSLQGIVIDCEKQTTAPADRLAMQVQSKLLNALSSKPNFCDRYTNALVRQAKLISSFTHRQFARNIQAGQAEKNRTLSPEQKQMLALLSKLVSLNHRYSLRVMNDLKAHLQPWLKAGQYQLAQQAYDTIRPALRKPLQPVANLAVARLLIDQVSRQNFRLFKAGMAVPRRLHPLHKQALLQCYQTQKTLDKASPRLAKIRQMYHEIINSYIIMEYFDIAEQAITLAAKPAVPAADRYAQITLGNFRFSRAQAEFNENIKRYKHTRTLKLTPAFATAIAEYKKYITTYPDSENASQAVTGIKKIAQLFQQHEAFDVAVQVHRDLAKFAATQKIFTQHIADQPSVAETLELAVAEVLAAKARHALNTTLQTRKPTDAPPAKMSAEYRAVLDQYKAFLKTHPNSALLDRAIYGISTVATRYVQIGAWDVANAVYADLLAAKLPLRRPERLEFQRGLCVLGKAMPSHARQILQTIQRNGIADGLNGRYDISKDDPRKKEPALNGLLGTGMPRPTLEACKRPKVEPKMPVKVLPKPAEPLTSGEFRGADYNADKALIAIHQHNRKLSQQIALKGDRDVRFLYDRKSSGRRQKTRQATTPVVSDAEIARQETVLTNAYSIFQSIRTKYPLSVTAQHARGEIITMITHWRSLKCWPKAAALTMKYLKDNPADQELPTLRLAAARDYLTWASQKVKEDLTTQEMLAVVAKRFAQARSELSQIVKAFPKEKTIRYQAQWDIATSFLTQARVVNSFSPTLSRGQYVRASRELQAITKTFHDHPQIGSIPHMLWTISHELSAKGYHTESISVLTDIANHYPTNSLAQQASWKIAQTYQQNLRQPLRAADAYMEMNFAQNGRYLSAQNAIFQIGSQLKSEQRWVEALHVLKTFVESFPKHANAGQALTMVGQIHQANEAWKDAIASYQRVIDEFPRGHWIIQAKWSIAECTINLSQWREAMTAYRDFQRAYPKDSRIGEATRRIGVLKDLARYQALVDEKGQRKAFDAQYQIASIVASQLANPVKAIIEYRKVQAKWPDSHLADDALFQVGQTYLSMGQTASARTALLEVGAKYPNSPLADDALYMVGQSYETEAIALAGVTRQSTMAKQKKMAQKLAYQNFATGKRRQESRNLKRIAEFKADQKEEQAELELARGAIQAGQYNMSNSGLFAEAALKQVQLLTAKQLADRQDKINAALRQAVASYIKASKVAGADKADESLLKMAKIYSDKLKDDTAAMKTYQEIVRQFSGTAVAEDASWRIAQYYERKGQFAKAIDAYKAFLRNYRRSVRAGVAQFAIAENYEHTGQWVQAMDAYTNYINNFPKGTMVQKAREQINWIKTYRL